MPKNKLYRFDPEAWLELETADEWYRQRSPEASVRFLAAVHEALETIVEGRNGGPSMSMELAGSYSTVFRSPWFISTNLPW